MPLTWDDAQLQLRQAKAAALCCHTAVAAHGHLKTTTQCNTLQCKPVT